MKRPSIPVCIILIIYLVVLFFMLILPPTTLGSLKRLETDYGRLFMNILALTAVAVLALFVLFLSKKLDSTPDRHSSTG